MPTTIYGDPERVTQIVINLLSNAFKFTEKGTVTLAVKQQAEQWIINVTDTGVGIPPHALNYIFDEFRQIDGSSTRVYGGSGLGLAIVRNLVRMMSGNIHVDSTLGKGSSFTVTLPLQTEQSETVIDNEAILELA
jgi:signal transduction histidine kinase